MKNKFFIIFIFFVSLILIFSAINFVSADSNCNPTIQIVNQDPIPAIPNDYTKVIIEISSLVGCNKFAVDLNPQYPFSLDPGTDPINVLEQTPYSLDYKNTWDIPYKIRVASDAIQGDYALRLLYHEGDSKDFSNYSTEQDLNISVVDSQTNFATVIQGVSGSQVSIGIVNTGRNTANSLIASIPTQSNYMATGTTQQIVGNLNAGDYSLVTFTVVSRTTRNFSNFTRGQQPPNQNPSATPGQIANQTLTIQLDYTDGIGQRRTVIEQIPFSLNSFSQGNVTAGNRSGFSGRTSTNSGISIWWYVGGVIVILIILFIVYKKYIKKKHHEKSSKNAPDWVNAERTHHKK